MSDIDSIWLKQEGTDCKLSLHVQAGAKTSEIVGEHGGRLKIRVAAQRIEGMANEHLVEFLAEALSLSKNTIIIEKGGFTKYKLLRIKNVTVQALLEKIQRAINN